MDSFGQGKEPYVLEGPYFRGSKCLDERAVDLERDALLEKLDLQHELLTSFVLHDLTAETGQRAADDSSQAARLQTLLTREGLSGLNQPMDVAQVAFDSVLVIDTQRADDGLQLERVPQILFIYEGENVAGKQDQMRADEPALVPLSTFVLRQEVRDIAIAEMACNDFLRAGPHVVGPPSFEKAGLDAEVEEVFGPDSGLVLKHRHDKTPIPSQVIATA
jgi:hypothetical protein